MSSFALVGQTLTFDSNQGGIIGFFLDIINSLIRGFNSVTGDTVEIDETEYDGSGSGSGMGESLEDDYFVLDGSGDEQEQGECTAVLLSSQPWIFSCRSRSRRSHGVAFTVDQDTFRRSSG